MHHIQYLILSLFFVPLHHPPSKPESFLFLNHLYSTLTFFLFSFTKIFLLVCFKVCLPPLPLTFFSLKAGPHTLFLSMFHSPTLGHAFPFCKTILSHRTHIHSLGSIVKKKPTRFIPPIHTLSFVFNSVWQQRMCSSVVLVFFVSFRSITCSPPSHFLSLLQLLSISPGFW